MAQTARSEGMGIEGGDGEVGQGWLEKGGNRRQNVLCYRLSVPLELFQLYGSSLKTGPFRGRFGKKSSPRSRDLPASFLPGRRSFFRQGRAETIPSPPSSSPVSFVTRHEISARPTSLPHETVSPPRPSRRRNVMRDSEAGKADAAIRTRPTYPPYKGALQL
jgi:hypothetical protein